MINESMRGYRREAVRDVRDRFSDRQSNMDRGERALNSAIGYVSSIYEVTSSRGPKPTELQDFEKASELGDAFAVKLGQMQDLSSIRSQLEIRDLLRDMQAGVVDERGAHITLIDIEINAENSRCIDAFLGSWAVGSSQDS